MPKLEIFYKNSFLNLVPVGLQPGISLSHTQSAKGKVSGKGLVATYFVFVVSFTARWTIRLNKDNIQLVP